MLKTRSNTLDQSSLVIKRLFTIPGNSLLLIIIFSITIISLLLYSLIELKCRPGKKLRGNEKVFQWDYLAYLGKIIILKEKMKHFPCSSVQIIKGHIRCFVAVLIAEKYFWKIPSIGNYNT